MLIPILGWGKARKALEDLGKVTGGREAAVGCDLPDVALGILHQLHRLVDPPGIEILQEVQAGYLLEEAGEVAF